MPKALADDTLGMESRPFRDPPRAHIRRVDVQFNTVQRKLDEGPLAKHPYSLGSETSAPLPVHRPVADLADALIRREEPNAAHKRITVAQLDGEERSAIRPRLLGDPTDKLLGVPPLVRNGHLGPALNLGVLAGCGDGVDIVGPPRAQYDAGCGKSALHEPILCDAQTRVGTGTASAVAPGNYSYGGAADSVVEGLGRRRTRNRSRSEWPRLDGSTMSDAAVPQGIPCGTTQPGSPIRADVTSPWRVPSRDKPDFPST